MCIISLIADCNFQDVLKDCLIYYYWIHIIGSVYPEHQYFILIHDYNFMNNPMHLPLLKSLAPRKIHSTLYTSLLNCKVDHILY